MNNAEFVERCTKVLCMNIATPPDWNEGEIMREALDRLESAERRIEELEKRENAKVYCMKCGENVAYLGD